MAAKRTLTDLAKALPDRERRRLLERISRSLSLHDQSQRNVYRSTVQTDERRRMLQDDLEKLPLWDRFLFWMRRISSTKGELEAYSEFKLDRLKRRIQTAPQTYVRFDRRTIEMSLPRAVARLYRATIQLTPFFRSIWEQPDRLQWMVTHLLERKVPNARTTTEHFLTLEEMQDIYLASNSKNSIRREVQRRLDAYLDTIPDSLFGELEEGILPLYLLKYLCLYPYRDFFAQFKIAPEALDAEELPEGSPAPAVGALESLEQLYFGLYTASRVDTGARIHPELIEAYDAYDAGEGGVAPTNPSTKRYNVLLDDASKIARELLQALPLVDIIRFFRGDPYHKLMIYLPRLRLKDFYHSHIRVQILAGIDEVFPRVRLGIVERISHTVFETEPPSLDFYRGSLVSAGRKLEAPPFRHFRALRATRHFVRTVYREDIATTIRLLARVMPVRYREAASELTLRANGIEEIGERIARFDYSFSPESDEGKSFYRVRYTGEKDVSQARTYRTIIVQKNREARSIVDDAVEHLHGLESVFRHLLSLGSRTIAERYEALTHTGRQPRLEPALERHAETIAQLRHMLNQLIEIEEG